MIAAFVLGYCAAGMDAVQFEMDCNAGTYASFWSYCQSEGDFNMKSTSSSSLFGETTRDKLYNSLFLVGPHLERYMAVGFLKCLDYLLVRLLSCTMLDAHVSCVLMVWDNLPGTWNYCISLLNTLLDVEC